MRSFTTYLCFDDDDEIEVFVEYSYYWDRDERGSFAVISEDSTSVFYGDEDITKKLTPEMWEQLDVQIEADLP